MQKLALSIAVIAVSGGYAMIEASQPQAELASLSAAADSPSEPAKALVVAPAIVPTVAPVLVPLPAPAPVPASVVLPSLSTQGHDDDEIVPAPSPAPFPKPRPKFLDMATPPAKTPAPKPALSPAKVTKASAPVVVAAASTGLYADGSYTGPVANAYYGYIQVRAIVTGGQLASVDILQYPSDRRTSVRINRYALPILVQEAIQNQSGRVNAISGATLTSNAYRQSLSAALAKAAI